MGANELTQLGLGAVIALLVLKEVFTFLRGIIPKMDRRSSPESDRHAGYNEAVQAQTVKTLEEILTNLRELNITLIKHTDRMESFVSDYKRRTNDGIADIARN